MSYVPAATVATTTAAAAQLQALGAMGLVVHVEPDVFLRLVQEARDPLVLHSPRSLLHRHRWALAHRGYLFWTSTRDDLPIRVQTVRVKRFWTPWN